MDSERNNIPTNTNTNTNANATNYLILTDAGKLVFSKYGDEASLSTICGLIQTLRATTLNDSSLGYGDIECINTSSSKLVFMAVGVILLVAIAYKDSNGSCETEDYIHRQLECIYSTIIFTLTDEIQYTEQDICYLLGSTHHKLRELIDDMSFAEKSSHSCRWLGGVDVVSPIPIEIRNYSSKVLATECSKTNSIIYAILSHGKKLFNIIQPHNKDHQLNSFDLNLLLHFFDSQTILPGNELWFPICLPRLSQSGFVHCYQCCLGISDIRLTLISQEPSIEEFQYLKSTATNIKKEMGIEIEKDDILRVYDLSSGSGGLDNELQGDEKLLWERHGPDHCGANSVGTNDIITEYDFNEEKMRLWKRRFCAYWSYSMREVSRHDYQDYCNMAYLTHFVFRHSVAIRHCNSGADSGGKLSQMFGPPLHLPVENQSYSETSTTEKTILKNYQKISLMLRQGSDTFESTLDSYNDITANIPAQNDTISQYRPSMRLNEMSISDDEYVTFIDGAELYVGLGGSNFEFYAVLPANLSSPMDAKILCLTLIETLVGKGEELQPLSFL